MVTVRLRDWTPVPHDLVQVDQAAKADTVQWTAHGPWLQAWVSAVCGQALPPYLGAVLERLRDWKPLAQDVVQVDQPPNDGKTQSTGHFTAALHARARLDAPLSRRLATRLHLGATVSLFLTHLPSSAPSSGAASAAVTR